MGLAAGAAAGYAAGTARKRVACVVEPVRVVSWDHRKLAGGRHGSPAPVAGTAATAIT